MGGGGMKIVPGAEAGQRTGQGSMMSQKARRAAAAAAAARCAARTKKEVQECEDRKRPSMRLPHFLCCSLGACIPHDVCPLLF